MIKFQPEFLVWRILFSEHNSCFLVACCFPVKTLVICDVLQNGNVNILAAAAFQKAYFSDSYCYNDIRNEKERG